MISSVMCAKAQFIYDQRKASSKCTISDHFNNLAVHIVLGTMIMQSSKEIHDACETEAMNILSAQTGGG